MDLAQGPWLWLNNSSVAVSLVQGVIEFSGI